MLKTGIITILLFFIIANQSYSKTCELNAFTIDSGSRPICQIRQVLNYRDGYQHCKDLHWRNFVASDRKYSQLEKEFTSKNLSSKSCQSEIEIIGTDYKRSERQLTILSKYLLSNIKILSIIRQRKEDLKRSLEDMSKWQADKIQKNMDLFYLIDFLISNQNESGLSEIDIDDSVKVILKEISNKIKDSNSDYQDKLAEILRILDGVDTSLILRENSASFIFKLKKYFELRKEFTQSEINFNAYTDKIKSDLNETENEESKIVVEINDTTEEKKISENDFNSIKIKKESRVQECDVLHNEIDSLIKTKSQVEAERNGSKNAHDSMCEDVYTECRWKCRDSTCGVKTIEQYDCI